MAIAIFMMVYEAFIDKSSTIRWVYHNFETINNATSASFLSQQQISSFSQSNYPVLSLLNSEAVWVQHQNEILPSFYLTLQNSEQQITNQLVFASNGELLYTNKLDMHMAADTPAYAYVYDPDPLTTAHQEYGGQYANNNGADNAELQAELKKRIIRGTLQGDSVILANNNFYIVRPILHLSRADTLKICKKLKIPIWIDPTNLDLKIKRNIVRKNILENLEKIYPGCNSRINTFIQKMNQYEKERSDLCKLALKACLEKNMLKRDKFNNLGLEARSTLLNQLFKEKFSKQIRSNNLDDIAAEIFKKNKGKIDLPSGTKIVWNKSYIEFTN